MINLLVTGSSGQLGQCLKQLLLSATDISCYFAAREDLDITNSDELQRFFSDHNFDYCINTAAYTNVEKAESEQKEAFLINAEGAYSIAKACKKHNVVLLHISTDYVFDGMAKTPYQEQDPTNPLNVYGASKLKGEQHIVDTWNKHFIIRTSWLYSQYGHNFLNSMLQFAKQKKALTITTQQKGTPTNANDLAQVLVTIIKTGNARYGVYHFSNQGEATWYDFAKAIFKATGEIDTVNLAKTEHYATFAKRPSYSVLNCNKLKDTLGITYRNWEDSLKQIINSK
ncbi:dTDP-4-dehydrorhamnose reductase [Flavobacteriaceae bacterium]|nr:dTDP-4-dehydrorhamnose reductase [Flavobacteriaceae bacterium]MDC0097227.1 dTDP-4-dehydrorhamnose reductase [Flavobacteriaceae bacterium]MDC1372820.1 dTDP-4-dehydrorhamnose reductase [Flavobacteriaceae bacterium]